MELNQVFHSDREVMGGTPVLTGTPVPVQNLVDYLEGGESIDDFGLKQLPKNAGEHLFEVTMRRYENRSTIMTSNRPLEEWGKLLGDVPTAGAILDRFLHHAQTIAITGRSFRLKDHATIAGKEDKSKKIKSKPNEPSTAEPAS